MSNRTYSEITEEKFEKLKLKLKDVGVDIQGNEGEASGLMNIILGYKYEKELNSLYLEIKDKPFLLPESIIYQNIEKVINGL